MPIQPAYTDGIVRLTAGSAVVRGTNTAWALRLVNGGLLTFGGRAIPIASVTNDTELTLANPSPVTYEGIYAIDLHTAEASTTLAAARRLADLLSALNGLSALGRQLTLAETAAAMRGILGALALDGSQAMTRALRLAPSSASNPSVIIPAGSATPAGTALVDGAVWGDGSNIITRLAGSTRVVRDSLPGSIPNANLGNMADGTVKMRRPGAGVGPPVDATIAQLIADIGISMTLSASGILRLPLGFVLQWGLSANGNAAEYSYSFPVAFQAECLCALAGVARGAGYPTNYLYGVSCDTFDRTSLALRKRRAVNGGVVEATADGFEIRWIAIGR